MVIVNIMIVDFSLSVRGANWGSEGISQELCHPPQRLAHLSL